MFDLSLAESAYELALADGGHTLFLDYFFVSGYCVAYHEWELVVPIEDRQACIKAIRNHVILAETVSDPVDAVGLWVNDGKLYIDLIRVYRDQVEAELAGRTEQQLAIFCLDDQTVINL